MKLITRMALAAGSAALGLTVLAACGSAHVSPKAKASISALATDPAVLKAEAQAKPVIQKCVNKVGLVHIALHPVKGPAQVLDCAAPGPEKKQVEKCWQHVIVTNGVGHGVIARDVDGWALCIANAKAKTS